MRKDEQAHDVIIIGAGPAGLAAAIYASRSAASTLLIEKSSAGGQVKTTDRVANYPGFIEPVPGIQLANNMRRQAEKYGAKLRLASDITALQFSAKEKWVELDDGERCAANYWIIATGASPRLLDIPGEREYLGNGVSYCATCDGDFYKDKDIFVVGGGNSAMEESLLLLQYVNSITVIHQFDELQAEKITAGKVLSHPKVNVFWSHEPRSLARRGNKMIMEAENLKTKERVTLERDGVFIFVGMRPNSDFLKDTPVQLAADGYIPTNEYLETNISGIFAAGDVREKRYRQITTAVADGTIAALEIIHRL